MKSSVTAVALFGLVLLVVGCSGPTAPMSGAPAAGGDTSIRGSAIAPFTGSFEGTQTVTPGTPPLATVVMNGEGNGTLVGRFDIALPHTVNFATSSASGVATLVAADGSSLVANFTGQAQIGPIVSIVEQATITGGTGRFANATGSFTIRRTFNPATGHTSGGFNGSVQLHGQ
jgi:hypothetical protein